MFYIEAYIFYFQAHGLYIEGCCVDLKLNRLSSEADNFRIESNRFVGKKFVGYVFALKKNNTIPGRSPTFIASYKGI